MGIISFLAAMLTTVFAFYALSFTERTRRMAAFGGCGLVTVNYVIGVQPCTRTPPPAAVANAP